MGDKMLNILKVSLIILLTCISFNYSVAQQYFVKTYAVEDSLPTRFVLDVTQSRSGLMWFATNSGVSNYDGFSFANYCWKDGLAKQHYRRLKFDPNGTLWALPAYINDTICYFKENKWFKIKPIPDLHHGLETINFDVMIKDGNPVLCVGSPEGIFVYQQDVWKQYRLSDDLHFDLVTSVIVREGKFLLSGNFGLCEFDNGRLDYGLSQKLDINNKPIIALTLDNAGNPNEVLWMMGYNWIGYLRDNNVTIIRKDISIPKIPAYTNAFLIFDKVGNIIFGNGWEKYLLEKKTDEIKPLQIRNGFSSNGATSVFRDREDNIWFTDTRGVDKINNLDLLNYYEENGLLENEVTAIMEINDGDFVFGHNFGLTILKKGKFQRIRFDDSKVNSSRVLDIMKDKDGNIWFTANELGVGRLGKDGNVKWYFQNKAFFVSSILQDISGRIWFGAMTKLYYIDNDKVVEYEHNDKLGNTCRKMFLCDKGGFYVAGVHGLRLVDGDSVKTIPSEDGKPKNVYSYLKTKDGDELVGAMDGLYKIENGKIVKFEKNGFFLDRPVYFILEDYRGHFWFGSNEGAYHWEGEKEVLRYSPVNGLTGMETNRAAGFIDSKDRVWIGTDKGLSCFSKTYTDFKIPVPKVDLMYIYDNKGKIYDLKSDNSIRNTNNTLRFYFRALTFINEDVITYEYKLEGYDSDWISVKQPLIDIVRYVNIPPGEYKFSVRAKNFSGEWGEVTTSGEITVRAPFYKTLWFILLVFLILSLFIYALLKIKIQAQEKEKLEKEIRFRKQIEDELIESKRNYKDIIDLLPETIFETDLEGTFTYMNNYGLKLFHYSNNDIENGLSVYNLFGKLCIDEIENYKAKENVQFVLRLECSGTKKEGTSFPIKVNAAPIYKDGKIIGIRGIVVDISEQKNSEEVLKKFARDMEELNASKDKFFSIVAHDLKNPFQGLLGFSEFLQTEYSNLSEDEKIEYIGYIRATSKNAYSLLENLLQWSRLQTGRNEVNITKVNVYAEVNSVQELLTPNLLRKKISFYNEVDKDVAVMADKNMIVSILQNLITNAIKFTNNNGEIRVSSKAENGEAMISIADTGIGIRQEDIPKLFRIEHNTTTLGTDKEGGTGLGLLLTKEMVELNGGNIKVESEIGKGSTFSFTLHRA